MNKNLFKSIGAVSAGFVTVFVLSVGTDFVLEKLGIFPPQSRPGDTTTWMLVLALAYRSVFTVLGGYVTALLAPSRSLRHAVILGIIGTVAATLGAIAGWDLSAHWYPIALVIGALPCTWLGGKLKN